MRTAALLTLVAVTGVAVGCGSEGADQLVTPSRPSSPSPTSSAATSTSTTAPAEGRIEGVVVDMGQNFEVDLRFWWLVDLVGGRSVEGASRLMIDVADDELGCGDDHHQISAFQISVGDTVSFELTGENTGAPPEVFMGGSDVSAARPVAARRFHIDCPADIDDIAATIADRRSRWTGAGIASYQFSMSWLQFNDLAGDYRITVVDGTTQSVVRGDGVVLDPERLLGRLPMTIDEVFDQLDRNVTADSFTATYDPLHGYPTEVHIDQVVEGVDDELEISITDFTLGSAGAPPPPSVEQAVLDAVPGTIDEVFQRLETEILAAGVHAAYHPELGYPGLI